MMKRFIPVAALFALGCTGAPQADPTTGVAPLRNRLSPDQLKDLERRVPRVGMSRDQIRGMFGPPSAKPQTYRTDNGQQEEIWEYTRHKYTIFFLDGYVDLIRDNSIKRAFKEL